MKKNKLDIFIEKSKKRHNCKYNYNKVQYTNSTTKVRIICPKHGEFWQTPQAHVRGDGCPLCAIEKKKNKLKSNLDEFINKANNVHNNEYTYENANYINASTKICITCKKHGDFWMTPSAHLNGQKCPKCQGKGLTTEDVVALCKEVHGDKYDYSQFKFTKMHEKVPIICPKHGIFTQTMSKHITKKQGCPLCAIENRADKRRSKLNELINKIKDKQKDAYDYSKLNYKNLNDKVEIVCPKHGSFYQRLYDHLQGCSCPKCTNVKSKDEIELFEHLKKYFPDSISGDRSVLNGKELDIFIPTRQIAIEYNGLRWHTEYYGKNKDYHLNKLTTCNSLGIKLITIFEDEYINHKDIVLNKLHHILHIEQKLPKIMGRKCLIENIPYSIAKEFLDKYHIQGGVPSTVYLGAFCDHKLIAVMTFTCHDKNTDTWELNRFASDYNYICQGVGGKLFNFFIKHYDPMVVKSFADRRWTISENNIYTKLGFVLKDITEPDYYYVSITNPKQRLHKFNFRKKILNARYNLPLSMTESEMTQYLGFTKIWNCGLLKYIYYNKK